MRRPRAESARRLLRLAPAALAAAVLAWPAGMAWAQAGTARTMVTPYASAQLTLTDNYDLNASAGNQAGDAISRLTAGVGVRSTAGRVQGELDYSLSALLYARHGDRNTLQHQLLANAEIEWYERQGFLTASASISQVARSAFGAPVTAGGLPNSNATEMRSLRLSPRWFGLLPAGLQIRLGGDAAMSSAKDGNVGDVLTGALTARVSPQRPGPLSWAFDLVHQSTDYELSRSARTSRAYGTVIWVLNDLDLVLSAQAGVERTNFASLRAQDEATWGLNAQWQPSPRTKLLAALEERAFGQTHQVSGEYRTPRTVWQLSDSRSIGTGGSSLAIGQRGRAFDLLFAEFASIEPDFARRAALVDAELARSGLSRDSLVFNTFLRSAVTIEDRREASFAWRHQRSSVLLNLTHAVSRRVDTSQRAPDDLDLTGRLRQSSLSLALGHKLGPDEFASLTLTGQSGRGDLASQRSRSYGLTAQWGGRFQPDDSWSLSLRHMRYETGLVPYTETALTATYGIRF